jgi:hypothetical protein
VLKAHEAAGCSNSVSSTRTLKPKEDQETKTIKPIQHPSTSILSGVSATIQPELNGVLSSYICSDPNCLAEYTSESDYALHMAMHTDLKITIVNCNT